MDVYLSNLRYYHIIQNDWGKKNLFYFDINKERFDAVLAPILLVVFCIRSKQNQFDAKNVCIVFILTKYSPEVAPVGGKNFSRETRYY